jgi:hypothetical protein
MVAHLLYERNKMLFNYSLLRVIEVRYIIVLEAKVIRVPVLNFGVL